MRILIAVVLSGCVAGEHESARWPDHRKQHDTALVELEDLVAKQQQLDTMRAELTKLDEELEDDAPPKPSPASDAAH